MSYEREWDVSLSLKRAAQMQLTIPAPIARSLGERGMNRAKLRVTKEGLLVIPYVSDANPTRSRQSVELPDWGTP